MYFLIILSLLFIVKASATDLDNSYYSTDVMIKTSKKVYTPTLSVCPVYNNKDIAFSMRWDDNNKSNFKMQSLMHKYGFKGTFYINGHYFEFKNACQKGTDLGAHSMTHPSLGKLNTNRIFWEVAEIKPYIECRSDKPVNSYCFSYGNYSSKTNQRVGFDIAEMLQRVGYHHNTYSSFIEKYTEGLDPVSGFKQITPGDKTPSLERFEKKLNRALVSQNWKRKDPNLSIGVHVWMKTPKAWNNMEEIFKKYSNRSDWWYCTQTDYAAYRKMFKLARITKAVRNAQQFRYKVALPYASDIGSDQPLTLSFNAIADEVLLNGKPVDFKIDGGKTRFEISPPEFARVPHSISYIKNEFNSPEPAHADKNALKPWLYIKDFPYLTLKIKNLGSHKISNVSHTQSGRF